EIERFRCKNSCGLMIAVIFANEESRQPREDDFRPCETNDSYEFFETLAVSPVGERIQDILRGSVFSAEKPDLADAKRRASLAGFDFSDVRHRRAVFTTVIVSAASAARTEYHRNSFVLIVDCARQIWRHCAFIIGVRNDNQNVHFVALVGSLYLLRFLRACCGCEDSG